MEHLGLTVRALTVLKALGIKDEYDLYDYELPLPGTVVQKAPFPWMQPLTMGTRTYEELTKLKEFVIYQTDKAVNEQLAQQMLDYPEDYGLI
jgi:hypothetical protein